MLQKIEDWRKPDDFLAKHKGTAFSLLSTIYQSKLQLNHTFGYMEKYPRGRRGSPAKGVGRVTVARVQIPLSPPHKNRYPLRIAVFCACGERKRDLNTKGADAV